MPRGIVAGIQTQPTLIDNIRQDRSGRDVGQDLKNMPYYKAMAAWVREYGSEVVVRKGRKAQRWAAFTQAQVLEWVELAFFGPNNENYGVPAHYSFSESLETQLYTKFALICADNGLRGTWGQQQSWYTWALQQGHQQH